MKRPSPPPWVHLGSWKECELLASLGSCLGQNLLISLGRFGFPNVTMAKQDLPKVCPGTCTSWGSGCDLAGSGRLCQEGEMAEGEVKSLRERGDSRNLGY